MKLLLLTDCPPCKNLTGGLVLDQLCRLLPHGSVVCFAVTNPEIEMKLTPDLDWIPIEYARKPSEVGDRRPAGTRRGTVRAAAVESYRRFVEVPPLIDRAADFARRHAVDAIWVVVEGQTITRMAAPLADRLKLPLFSLVWDPLSWWMAEHKVDRWNARVALRQFDATIRRSEACAVASWAMAEHYERIYGVRSVPVIASHDAALAASPAPSIRRRGEVVLGMAGQFYASDEWHGLVRALNDAGWRVGGRDVRLKVLGHYVPASDVPEGRLDFLGWKTQPEAIEILSRETDVLYCPYPFDPKMEEVSRFSFPSKLPLYFAAGRPVLFHGPDYASPAGYLLDRDAGLVCTSSDGAAVLGALERLVTDPALYERLTRASQAAFRHDFTLDTMRANFFEFLGWGEEAAAAAQERVALRGAHGPTGMMRMRRRMPPLRSIARRLAFKVPKIQRLYNYTQELRAQRDRLALQIATLHDARQELADERESLRRHIGYLEGSRDRLLAENDAVRTEAQGLRAKMAALEAERAVLHRELGDKQALVAERDALARRLRGFDAPVAGEAGADTSRKAARVSPSRSAERKRVDVAGASGSGQGRVEI